MHPLERWRLEEQERRGKPYRRYHLADDLGCVPSRLTQIIQDGERPGSDLAVRIKELTGISTDEIFDASKKSEPAGAPT